MQALENAKQLVTVLHIKSHAVILYRVHYFAFGFAGIDFNTRVFAGAVGTSLVSTGWNDRTILHHAQLAEQTSVNSPNFVASIAALQNTLGGSAAQAMAFFESSLNTQAAMLGLNDIFWLSAVIFIAIIPLIWITKPSKDGAAAAAGAGGH